MPQTPTLVTIEEEDLTLADSRQIAKELGIQHRSFFRMILEYQQEVEEDFGKVRFEITASGKTNQSLQYARLTEDQTYVYLAYSQNTEQARKCKRKLVKAFAMAREIILTLKFCPRADIKGRTTRQIHMMGLAGQIVNLDNVGLSYDHLMKELCDEALSMTPEESTWKPFAQPVKLLR